MKDPTAVIVCSAMIDDALRTVVSRIERAAARAGRQSSEIQLVAVVKTVDRARIQEIVRCGVVSLGESRVQEAREHYSFLRGKPVTEGLVWHMIGHLQSNKAKEAVGIFDLIQSVDSLRIAEVINQQAIRRQKTQDILIEVKLAAEASKYGFRPQELQRAFESIRLLPNVRVKGLMMVAPVAKTAEQVRPYFCQLRQLRDRIADPQLKHLSMGMSDDFEVAIEEGATMVRIGRAIFGER